MHVLVIWGGIRKNGNTRIITDAILQELNSQGVRTSLIEAAYPPAAGCTSCGRCRQTGECSIRDRMLEIYPLLLECHRIVVVSPVYFMGFPSQAKALIDRTQALWSRWYILGREKPYSTIRRYGVLVACGGTRGKRMAEGMKLTTKYFLDAAGMEFDAERSLIFRQVDASGEILLKDGAMEAVRRLAEEISKP